MSHPIGTTEEPTHLTIERWFEQLDTLGGHGTDRVCRARETIFEGVGRKPKVAYTCGCGSQALGVVPYQREDGDDSGVVLCCVCDGTTYMPRFLSGTR